MTDSDTAQKIVNELAHYLNSYTPLNIGEPIRKDFERIVSRHLRTHLDAAAREIREALVTKGNADTGLRLIEEGIVTIIAKYFNADASGEMLPCGHNREFYGKQDGTCLKCGDWKRT
jgi:hypothetical protein